VNQLSSAIMMSVKSWLILLVIYIAYLILGGYLFQLTECQAELETKRNEIEEDKIVSDTLIQLKSNLSDYENLLLDSIVNKWTHRLFSKNTTNSSEPIKCVKWNFQNSLFFSFTVVTTIGYGHQSTTTPHGRVLCVAYAILGVPLNAILIGALGSVFSNQFIAFKKKLWQGFGKGEVIEERPRVLVVIVELLVFITFFSSIFLLIPAAIFKALENDETNSWDYTDSFYYTFITLSTIGFGDMVPDRQQNQKLETDFQRYAYLVAIILWIIFGMGYIFAVVDVISGSLKSSSKPVKKALRGLKNQMHVNDYWRKIIGEIIVLKHGDVGVEENNILVGGAGGSEPCLGEFEGIINPAMRRSVSTGDIQDGPDSKADDFSNSNDHQLPLGRSLSAAPNASKSKVPSSSNFLTVPGGHSKTRSVSSDDLNKSVEEINEDTITSLRQFLTNARITEPDAVWMENNLPGFNGAGDGLAPTRRVSRNSSIRSGISSKQNHLTVGGFGNNAGHELVRRSSLQNKINRKNSVRSNMSRQSTISGSNSATGGPIGALLEQTTLGEFLTAVENVRRKSTMHMDTLEVNSSEEKIASRRNSLIRKFSRKKSNNEAPVMPQLSSLFLMGDQGKNMSDIPLLNAGVSPTISEKIAHGDLLCSGDKDDVVMIGVTQHM